MSWSQKHQGDIKEEEQGCRKETRAHSVMYGSWWYLVPTLMTFRALVSTQIFPKVSKIFLTEWAKVFSHRTQIPNCEKKQQQPFIIFRSELIFLRSQIANKHHHVMMDVRKRRTTTVASTSVARGSFSVSLSTKHCLKKTQMIKRQQLAKYDWSVGLVR